MEDDSKRTFKLKEDSLQLEELLLAKRFTFLLNSMKHTILIKAVRSKLSTTITSEKCYGFLKMQ